MAKFLSERQKRCHRGLCEELPIRWGEETKGQVERDAVTVSGAAVLDDGKSSRFRITKSTTRRKTPSINDGVCLVLAIFSVVILSRSARYVYVYF